MANLDLVRHAQVTVDPQLPSKLRRLSSEGERAAARLREHLSVWRIAAVVSSPKPKALSTVRFPAGTRLIEIEAGLRELDRQAQCGFKALSRRAARELLPTVENQSWFFDTELLLLAEERGMRIYEVPVQWVEDLDSRVNITKTALEDMEGLLRVRRQRWGRRFRVPENQVVG